MGAKKKGDRVVGVYKETNGRHWRVTWYENRHRKDSLFPTKELAENRAMELKGILKGMPEREVSSRTVPTDASVTWQEPGSDFEGGTAEDWLKRLWGMMDAAEMIISTDEEERVIRRVTKTLDSVASVANAARKYLDLTHSTKSIRANGVGNLDEDALFRETLKEIKKNPKLFKAIRQEYDDQGKEIKEI